MKDNLKKRMNKEDRRQQILDSALNAFVKKGYNGTTTIDIAEEAKVSEVTLFRYFDSKKEIFIEAVKPILAFDFEEAIIGNENLNPKKKFSLILKNRIKFVSKNNEVIKLILIEDEINKEIIDFNYIDQTSFMFKKSLEKSGLKIKPEDLSIRLLMGSLLSFLYFPEEDEEKIDEYIDIISHNIFDENNNV